MNFFKKPIGLFGGTFDPIHWGHIDIGTQLIKDLNWDIVQFIPNKRSPLRNNPHVSDHHRLTMLRLALADYYYFIVNDMELARPAPSYTIDTVNTLRALAPAQPFCLILGTDAFNHFNEWYQCEDIAQLVHLVVITRPTAPIKIQEKWMHDLLTQRQTLDPLDLGRQPGGKIFLKEITPIYISASEIRRKIAQQEDVSAFLPPMVLNYIRLHQLYKMQKT